MKRTRVLLIALVAAGLVVSTAAAAAAEKVKITFYHRSTQVIEVEWAKEVVRRFNATHPNIEAEFIPSGTGGGNDYQEKYLVLAAAGNAPDVYTGYADKMGFIVNGMALDITSYVQRDLQELQTSTFFPGTWESPVYQGRHYGVPLTITTQHVFYNKDLFAKAGLPNLPASWDDKTWTWDRFLAYAKQLTVADAQGRYQQLAISQVSETKLPDICLMFGGDWFEPQAYETGWAKRVTMNRPENAAAYQAVRDLYAQYAAAGPAKGISANNGMIEGKIGMDWIGGWKISTYLSAVQKSGLPFGLAIGPPPLVQNRANTRWTNPLFISASTKHPDEAWEFVKFATSQESQELWARMTRLMPARRTAAGVYVESLKGVFDMPSADILTAIGGSVTHSVRSIEEAVAMVPFEISRRTKEWIDPMLNGQKSIESSLATMEAVLNAYIAEVNQQRGIK